MDDASNAQQDIRNDFTNFQFATPRAVQDVTGVDKSASERLLLLADFSITFSGVFNPAANMSHDVFKTVPSTSVARACVFSPIGTTATYPKLPVNALFTDYKLTRSTGGDLTWQAPGVLSDGTVPTWTVN